MSETIIFKECSGKVISGALVPILESVRSSDAMSKSSGRRQDIASVVEVLLSAIEPTSKTVFSDDGMVSLTVFCQCMLVDLDGIVDVREPYFGIILNRSVARQVLGL
jgi:hypothetical protein